MKRFMIFSVFVISIASLFVSAQQQPAPTGDKPISASLGTFVYPKNNQNMEQQKKDEMDCFYWAKQQTGIDPMAPAPPPQQPQQTQQAGQTQQGSTPKGGGVKGAAGGAAAGAAIGAIAGDAGTGAAIGATAGAMKGRRTQKKAEKQAEAQAKQQQQQAQQQAQQQTKAQDKERKDTFNRAFGACLESKGYTVK